MIEIQTDSKGQRCIEWAQVSGGTRISSAARLVPVLLISTGTEPLVTKSCDLGSSQIFVTNTLYDIAD
jgi:hypothetical protein